MRKVTRIIRNHESVRLLAAYLDKHLDTKEFPVRVVLEKYEKARSLDQNGLFHGWCGEIAEQTGHSTQEVKDAFKQEFAPKVAGPTGMMIPLGTSKMTTVQMTDFLTQVQVKSAEMEWTLGYAA